MQGLGFPAVSMERVHGLKSQPPHQSATVLAHMLSGALDLY